MKIIKFSVLMLSIIFISCKKEKLVDEELKYVPRDVLVKVKSHFTTNKVFDFINGFNHEVENINSLVYSSSLPSDSLQFVLSYINSKPYTNIDSNWLATGYIHSQTGLITIFPWLFNMTNQSFQNDWLESIELLKLSEQSGSIIHFKVPEGQEKTWKGKFEEYEFVEWAELNYILRITR